MLSNISLQIIYKKSTWQMLGAIFDKWWSQSESNQRHKDFQSFALPTEL